MVALVQKSVWDQVRDDYDQGNYKTLVELAERHGVKPKDVFNRVQRSWKQELEERKAIVSRNVDALKEDLAKDYLSSTFKRAKRYEKLIDLSQEQLAAASGVEGLPILDPDALLAYSKVEATVHGIAKSALRISDKVDLTTGGQTIGDSFVTAIQKLREDANTPKLTSAQIDSVLEAEIIPD